MPRPRSSPGTGRGDGAHQEPLVEVRNAPGACQGRGDPVKEESEKVGLKLNFQKTKIMASGPIISWEIDGETVETVSDFIFWAKDSALLSSRDAGLLEPPERPQGSPASSSVWSPKIKSDTVSTVSPSISHEEMGPDAMILVF